MPRPLRVSRQLSASRRAGTPATFTSGSGSRSFLWTAPRIRSSIGAALLPLIPERRCVGKALRPVLLVPPLPAGLLQHLAVLVLADLLAPLLYDRPHVTSLRGTRNRGNGARPPPP